MKILITGASGLVASRVIEIWSNQNTKSAFQLFTPDLEEFDLLEPKEIQKYLRKHQPDLVIHFAAYTNVTEAESQSDNKQGDCWQINIEGTRNLLNQLKTNSQQLKAKFIHISTDMVFSDAQEDPGPYAEDHQLPASPEQGRRATNYPLLTWYGWTKLQAELLVREAGATIVRIIYPVRAHFDRPDYLRHPLQLYAQGKLYPLFADQHINFTFIDHLAEVLFKLLSTNYQHAASTIFHVATSNLFTPYELIKYTVEKLGQDTSPLKTTSITDFLKTQTNPHRYPIRGGLKTDLTQKALDLQFPTWQQVIDQLIAQDLDIPS